MQPYVKTSEALPDAVARLAGSGPQGYLAPHQVEAAAQLLTMFERASLRQRVTMSYDPARVGRSNGSAQGGLAASAADARKRLALLAECLPADCWGLLADVCVYDKGLQQIEGERGWPRRAAKLVLRIGLEQSAILLGLGAHAMGRDRSHMRNWLPERVAMFDGVSEN